MLQRQVGERVAISYAWIVLTVLFIGLVASFGMRASFGAYISPWEQEFSVSRTVVVSISMLSFVVYAVGQPLAGKLNDHFSKNLVPAVSIFLIGISLLLTSRASHIWQVFILFGVVFSLGVAGCCTTICAAIVTNWFVKKRGLALGLSASGLAVGQLIMIPANLFIIDRLGWRAALAILSVIIMAVVGPLFIFLLRSRPEEKGLKPYGYTESVSESAGGEDTAAGAKKLLPVVGAFKTKAFWQLSIPYFVCGFTDVGLIQTHLIPMAQGRGFPTPGVALAFSLIAVFSIAGTIITGHLSDHVSRSRQLAIIFALRAATYSLLFSLQRPWLLLLFAVVYGLAESASVAPTNSLTVQVFNRYSIGAILGLVSLSHQLGGAFGSWLPGLLFDLTGSYSAVLAISIAMLLGAACIALRIKEERIKGE